MKKQWKGSLWAGLILLAMSGAVQAANTPAWWHTRGLINTNLVSNDYAPANIGQLKNVAYQTWMEVTNQLAQVSGVNKALYVNGAGQVGIGTTNPAGQLHVQKALELIGMTFTGTGLNDLTVNYSGYTGSGDTRYIVKVSNSGPTPNKIQYSADNGATWSGEINMVNGLNVGQGVTISFGALGGHTYNDHWAWTVSQGFADTLVIRDDKVGIGTATPAAKLDVAGEINAAQGVRVGNNTSATPAAGTIRWTGTDFEGYTGSGWISLTAGYQGPAGLVLVSGGTLPDIMNGVITVTNFYMGKYEVTWGEWQTVRTWAVANGYDLSGIGAGCADNHPVYAVNWYDVVKWCNARSEKEGRTPVYTVGGTVYKTGQNDSVVVNPSANGYRLPTDAEWEYAARGGTHSHGYTYSGGNDLNALGWYSDNSGGAACDLYSGLGTWPVGQKGANELRLYDMSGNVWEWCFDWYPGYEGSWRVGRGGSWYFVADFCRAVAQLNRSPAYRDVIIGFRLARSVGQ